MSQYNKIYVPLFEQYLKFLRENEKEISSLPDGSCLPFLPVAGVGYYEAKPKILFLGQDTGSWDGGIANAEIIKLTPESLLAKIQEQSKDSLNVQSKENFVKWYIDDNFFFWDFPIRFILQLNNKEFKKDFLQKPEYPEILSSFAWGNCNTLMIPKYAKDYAMRGKPPTYKFPAASYRKMFNSASSIFDKLQYHIDTLNPDIIIMLTKGYSSNFFEKNLEIKPISEKKIGKLIHRTIINNGPVIYQTYHPSYIRRKQKDLQLTVQDFVDSVLSDLPVDFA